MGPTAPLTRRVGWLQIQRAPGQMTSGQHHLLRHHSDYVPSGKPQYLPGRSHRDGPILVTIPLGQARHSGQGRSSTIDVSATTSDQKEKNVPSADASTRHSVRAGPGTHEYLALEQEPDRVGKDIDRSPLGGHDISVFR